MAIVQNIHEQKDTPCYKYLQNYKPFVCFLNIFHILSSYMKMIRFTILGGRGRKKKGVFIIARCAHCMLHYLYARPGWLEVQLSGILINWTAICFCMTRHLYTGSSCLWKSFVSTWTKISFEHFLGKIRLWSPDDITVDFKTQDLCFLFKKMAQSMRMHI